jgi:hypothetical protein
MTLTERARQIDQEDFRRDSERSLQRALTYSKRKQDERRRRFLIHAFGEEGSTMALDTLHAPTLVDQSPLPTYTFGKLTLSAGQWANRLGVETETLFRHAKEHGSIQAALTYCMTHRHKKRGKPATAFECNGLNLTRRQWAKRLGITTSAFDVRRRKFGIAIAVAMGGPNQRGRKATSTTPTSTGPRTPGVVFDFLPFLGTGGGRTVQETPNIGFYSCEEARPE